MELTVSPQAESVVGCASATRAEFQNIPLAVGENLVRTAVASSDLVVRATSTVAVRYVPAPAAVQPSVSATAPTATVAPGVIGATQGFVVRNIGTAAGTYELGADCGTFLNCGQSLRTVSIPAGGSVAVDVTFDAPASTGTGTTVGLTARYNAVDGSEAAASGSAYVSTATLEQLHGVTVGAVIPEAVIPQLAIGAESFQVKNTGSLPTTYRVLWQVQAPFSIMDWHYRDTLVTLNPGETKTVMVNVTAPDVAGKTSVLTVTVRYTDFENGSLSATGTMLVSTRTPAYSASVTPAPWSEVVSAGPHEAWFTITNTGEPVGVPFMVHCTGIATNCRYQVDDGIGWGQTGQTATLGTGESRAIGVLYDASGASGTISLRVGTSDWGYPNVTGDSSYVSLRAAGVESYQATIDPADRRVKVVASNAVRTATFVVRNVGSAASMYAFRARCERSLNSYCVVNRDSSYLAVRDSAVVQVSYAGPFAPSDSVVVRLTATSTKDTTYAALGALRAVAENPFLVTPTVVKGNGGPTTERGVCVALPIWNAGVWECGDLRIEHPLQSIRTYGQTRTPVLTYNSRQAMASGIITLDLAADPDATVDSVVILGARKGSSVQPMGAVRWLPSWERGARRRVTIQATPAQWSLAGTGLYPYVLEVRAYAGGTQISSAPVEDTLALVDRSTSYFGRGWWLDGVEQIVSTSDPDAIMWVAGDGSTRLYRRSADSTFKPTVTFVAPDVLYRLPTGGWRRQTEDNLRVEFDGAGRHVKTINPLGRETRFTYLDGTKDHLTGIEVPTGSASAPRYEFVADLATPYLGSVVLNAQGSTSMVRIQRGSAGIGGIVDADGVATAFGYTPLGDTLISHTDRGGTTVTFVYGRSGHVERAGSGGIVQEYCPAEAVALSYCQPAADPDSVRTKFQGPRFVGDSALYYVDSYGAPSKVVAPGGAVTKIERANKEFPGLVTRTEDPVGVVRKFAFNPRGLLDSVTETNALGDGRTVKTSSLTWHPRWRRPTTLTTPAAKTTYTYYSDVPLRRTEQTGSNSARQVVYQFNSGWQLERITLPKGRVETYEYEAKLRNPKRYATPQGVSTLTYQDAWGRDTGIVSQIDAGANVPDSVLLQNGLRKRLSLTPVGFVQSEVTEGWRNGAIEQVVSVTYVLDNMGRPTQTWREAAPNLLGPSITWAKYDAFGRKYQDIAADSQTTYTYYDAAGNVDSLVNRNGERTWMTYDAAGHLTRRIVPGKNFGIDTATFAYDIAGRMLRADNGAAQVHRGYFPNGLLRVDTLRIGALANSRDFSRHQYVLAFTYDDAARRKTLTQVSGIGPIANSTTTYDYDSDIGLLTNVIESSGAFNHLEYDAAGRLVKRKFGPLGGDTTSRQEFDYDADDRKTLHREVRGTDSLANYLATYDAQGHRLMGDGTFVYTRLGVVAEAERQGVLEELSVDAFGNQLSTRTNREVPTRNVYEPKTLRLLRSYREVQTDDDTKRDTTVQAFDPAGNMSSRSTQTLVATCADARGCRSFEKLAWSDATYWYAADGKLDQLIRRTSQDVGWIQEQERVFRLNGLNTTAERLNNRSTGRGVHESYRYDALGRRVLVWSRRGEHCLPGDQQHNLDCYSAVERTVWDGDQVLVEIRQPADDSTPVSLAESDAPQPGTTLPAHWGVVRYSHDVALDQPPLLQRIRPDGTRWLVVHRDLQGQVFRSSGLDGSEPECRFPGAAVPCLESDWPGQSKFTLYLKRVPADTGAPSWNGSLAQGHLDASGLQYKRNRYFDPSTGKFTQEDPIGFAGGLNLYGLGEGDPTNFSDPFGLCDPMPGCLYGWGSLQSSLADVSAGASATLSNAVGAVGSAMSNAAGRVSASLAAGAGLFTTKVAINARGPSLSTGPVLGSEAIGAKASIDVRLQEAPEGAIVSGELGIGVRQVGPLQVSANATIAANSSGDVRLTSVSISVGGGLSRTETGKSTNPSVSVSPSSPITCNGSGCP